ncbi:MAG TPA: hypothetical protein VG126_09945 [Thermoleophilaceae bacterium]|nr:hypothetical protein [Thermoleophilaceae bacterium]
MLRTLLALLVVTAAVVILVALDGRGDIDAADAEAVALDWVGTGFAQAPRRDGDEWEVDVIRPNGSMVEVTIGDGLEARGFDEELGPGGTLAPDELTGERRIAAIDAALAEAGPGEAFSVEQEVREGGDQIEVSITKPDGRHMEVELNDSLEVLEVEDEDPRDE